MFIAAGLLLATAFGLFARRVFVEDGAWTTQVVLATALALAGAAAAITFAVILII
jgi:hypothetical protein